MKQAAVTPPANRFQVGLVESVNKPVCKSKFLLSTEACS